MSFDVAIIGAGPAGSTCAALCAQAGLRTLLLEKSVFPREKVCGDCLNPGCWPILERLGVAARVLAEPHSRLAEIEFISLRGRSLRHRLDPSPRGEVAIKRSLFDAVLLARAREMGVVIHEGVALTALESGWRMQTTAGAFQAETLVAADGRNSTVARLLGLLPAAAKDRVGLQTHLPAPADFGERVAMHFLPVGYCGVASVGDGQINVCLVSRPEHLSDLKAWTAERFPIAPDHPWRTTTPHARAALPPAHRDLLLVGDAARVVEPFTGEGIYYALASGEIAARHIIVDDLPGYASAHASLYRRRLWINEMAKAAVLHPRIADAALGCARYFPHVMTFLTSKVVGPSAQRISSNCGCPDAAPKPNAAEM